MPLVSSLPFVEAAARAQRAVFAFNVSSLEMAQGVVQAAEATRRPLLVQFNRNGLNHFGGVEVAAAALRALTATASIPIALHLDHADGLEELRAALAAGFTSLMIDGSTLAFADHLALAREAHGIAAAAECPLEAELGHVSGTEAGVTIAEGSLTDPEEAARFVAGTGVEMLAVSIGNVHGRAPAGQTLDLALLSRIQAATQIPLVLHGASGVPPGQLQASVERGVAKINVGSGLQRAFLRGLRDGLQMAERPDEALAAGRAATLRYAKRLLQEPYAASGTA